VSLPTWAKNWNMDSFSNWSNLNPGFFQKAVDAILPASDTPGAKDIGAHLFVERMIRDCYGIEAQNLVADAIKKLENSAIEKFKTPFSELENAKAVELFKSFESSHKGIGIIKNLTIRAYTNSEYYLVNHKNYNIAPAFFNGCVDLQ
nr:gluconate 2-dehydrogenase subunit 3 family protein [Oculatellaceae cyanobacterium Prado106]